MLRCKHICKPLQAQTQTKVCKRASTSATEKIIFYSFPSKNFKNAIAQADTERQESKMTMTQKLNNDNGLQGWNTEHQAVTCGIFYCRVSAEIKVCGSLQAFYQPDSDVLRNRQQNIPLSVGGKCNGRQTT
jgi:hypothetical protein